MLPLYHEPHFTFRFGEDRLIPRFHLEGVKIGRRVSVFKIEPGTGDRLGLLTTAVVGEGGWVEPGKTDHRPCRRCIYRRTGLGTGFPRSIACPAVQAASSFEVSTGS